MKMVVRRTKFILWISKKNSGETIQGSVDLLISLHQIMIFFLLDWESSDIGVSKRFPIVF